MRLFKAAALASVVAAQFSAPAVAQEGVLIRCGASAGHAYFFRDEVWNPDGPGWMDDGMSNGQIMLVRLGDEWDILFDDILGGHGYRQDGATVLPLGSTGTLLTVGAFHQTYTAIYTFNMRDREVAWTSSKMGPLGGSVAVFHAQCE